ncbi:MAG: hypothetical protein IJL33_08205 [Ruminococcus sp.]|jgi:hypothetical protein|uniref:Antitoxin Phd_YefM, type II toxin-antitoxin system n=1 Tax=Ruminococcus flavefaciens TaxID=1265 RepID=A0A1K1N827_RUMFL|nr:hypothetical protein [Ruminococcus flavefaciens]MBQ6035466.1 hypothetical protein [Ruminococcus sp.]SFW30494.1 hypothetical protein SAMN02910280_1727 [Ruminococcus flavefaciens]
MISIKNEDFCENYELFEKLCSMTGEPIRLVKDNCSDMIVMTADTFEKRRKMLDLREKILGADADTHLNFENDGIKKLGQYISELEKNGE